MAQKTTTQSSSRFGRQPEYFEVTCVVGRVELNPDGDRDPVEAAFSLIGAHRAEGVYRFPHESGGEWVVSVDVSIPPSADEVEV